MCFQRHVPASSEEVGVVLKFSKTAAFNLLSLLYPVLYRKRHKTSIGNLYAVSVFAYFGLTSSCPCLQWPCRASRPSPAPLRKEPARPRRVPTESAAATSLRQSLSSSAWTSPTAKSQFQHLAPVLDLWRTLMAPGTTSRRRVSSKCQYRGSSRASRWRTRTDGITITHISPTSCSPRRGRFIITGLRPRTHPSHPAFTRLRDPYGRTPGLCTASVKTIWRPLTERTLYLDSHCFLSNTRSTGHRACPPVRWNLTDLFTWIWTRTSRWTATGFWAPLVWGNSRAWGFLTHSTSPTATTSWTTRAPPPAEERWARRGFAPCAGTTRPASTTECAPVRAARVSLRFVLKGCW